MSMPAEEVRRRVPVARPSSTQLLTNEPGAAFRSQAMGQYTPVAQNPAGPAPRPVNASAPVGTPQNPVQLGEVGQRVQARATPPAARRAAAEAAEQLARPSAAPPAPQVERSAAYRAGQRIAPVARAAGSARGALSTAAGKLGGTGAGALLTGGLVGLGTDTQTYADRFGVDAPQTVGGDVALRTAGVASDVVAAIPDFAIGAANFLGRGVKAAFPNAPDFLTAQAPTMSDLYARNEQQTRMGRAAQENGGTLPAGMALAIGPNGEAPRPLPAVTAPTQAQMVAGQRPAPAGAAAQPAVQEDRPQSTEIPASQPEADAADTVGTINGRTITRAESDRLANQNVVPGGAAAALGGQSQQRREQGFVMPPRQSNDARTIEMIDKAIGELGPLDRRGRRQALVDLLSLRQRGISGDLDRNSLEGRSAADLAQRDAASQLGADVDREQIAAQTANARRQTQTITDAQGNVYGVDGNTLTPLTTPGGQQLVAPLTRTQQADPRAELAANLLQKAMESGLGGDPNMMAAQAVQTANAMYANLSSPPGMTPAGTTPEGVPIYKDAQGRTFTNDGK